MAQESTWYAIGMRNKETNIIYWLADRMYDDLDKSIKQVDEWYTNMHTSAPVSLSIYSVWTGKPLKAEPVDSWEIFVIPSVEGLCNMSNNEQLILYKNALYKK